MKKIRQSHRCNSGSAIFLGVTLFMLAILQPAATKGQAENIPLYGNWKTYSTKDGLPSNKVSCVRIDEDRIWAGTSEGLALYEDDKWTVFTTEDGLAHDGVLSIDISQVTGDVWVATLSGLSRFSGGKFDTFNQFNSGLPNDVIYNVVCDGKDVWVATGGGAGVYDTYSKTWGIYTEQNAPMHEPWTYGVTAGGGKIYIAAWGGGVIEYNKKTSQFRDYVDPDGEMEIDLFPDDGLVHNITTGVTYGNDILWVGTYFGLSRYDGARWLGYFDHDSGLASNFINFLKADGSLVWICTDKGLSSFDGQTWVTYVRNKEGSEGQVRLQKGDKTKIISAKNSISHNFVLGVDVRNEEIWVATSDGLTRGEKQGVTPVFSSSK
jgi:ligand-binding sensor domain-containing protein